MMRSLRRAVGLSVFLSSVVLLAQTTEETPVNLTPRVKPATSVAGMEPLLRVDSSLVLLPVHVSDGNGRAVADLPRQSFRVLEDGAEQKVSVFLTEDAPVSVCLLFDASGSMRLKMQKSSEAAAAFFREANPEDEFSLVEFNDRARLLLPFTQKSDDVYRRISRIRPF